MKRWYVVQAFAGYEEAVKADIEKNIVKKGYQELIGQVLVPSAKLKQFFDAAETEDQQLFPGYLLIEAELVPEVHRLISTTPRVLRFLGGVEPVPLSKKEIERILSQIKGEIAVAAPKESEFSVGSEADIKEGPFAGFVGIVESIDQEAEKLTVMVSIFGRMTPVELSFDQVKR